MALSATTTLPHSVPSVAAVLVNEDFQRHVSKGLGRFLDELSRVGLGHGEAKSSSGSSQRRRVREVAGFSL